MSATGSTAQVNRYEVVIDEIMADPAPTRGLPEAEFIELKNVSTRPVSLNGWKLQDATTTVSITTNFVLQPDSFVVLCSTGARAALAHFGTTLGISNFPSLDNDGETVALRANDGKLVHAVAYDKSWYANNLKAEGGCTLEMIDTRNACSGAANWKASLAEKGGTPGKKNSADAIQPDETAPVLLRSYAQDSLSLVLVFDETLDSTAATVAQKYVVDEGMGVPRTVAAVSPLFTQLILYPDKPLQKNKLYTVSARDVRDCSGNVIRPSDPVKTGLPVAADSSDIVINEVLFNPRPDGVDYVELYNRSKNIIDIKELYIANRTANNGVSNLHRLFTESRLLFPQEYLLITENIVIVQRQYLVKNPTAFAETTLPSYPDDKGTIVILNSSGRVIDELGYDEKWHFKLIDNREGVALERINPDKPTQDAGNWHSASTASGYGTPAYRNSQSGADPPLQDVITVSPGVFSPDNDGRDDFATISYRFPEAGYVCNMSVFSVQGFAVKILARNILCGTTGYVRWDGLDERGNRLPGGMYILLVDIFNLKGETKRFKQVITLAKKLT